MARKKLSKNLTRLTKQYIQSLRDDGIRIHRVLIFGSRVKGTHHTDSDLDVAIISPDLDQSLYSTQYLLEQAHRLPYHQIVLEPHGFHPKEFTNENPLVWEIKKFGVPIK